MFTAGRKGLKEEESEMDTTFIQVTLLLGMLRISGWGNSIYYT